MQPYKRAGRYPNRLAAMLGATGLLGALALAGCGGGSGGPGTATPTPTPGGTPAPTLDSRIAFASDRDGNLEIYSMKPDGSDVQRLTNNAAADNQPSWSYDRTRIAFTSERDGNFEIYVMNRDGSNIVRLTNNAAADVEPAFSPDGQRILFTSNRDGQAELYTINVDGTGLQRITNDAQHDQTQGTWSPDGQRIAYVEAALGSLPLPRTTQRAHHNQPNGSVIIVADAEGTNPQQITSSNSDHVPAWSPDGSKIAFRRNDSNSLRIHLVAPDGSGDMTLPANTDSHMAFSPNNDKLVFATTEIFVITLATNAVERLTNNGVRDEAPDWR